jgi:Fe-Mn family superoxide dismutase
MKNLINRIDRLEEEIYRVEMKKGYLREEKKVKNVKGKIPIEKLPYKFDSLKKFIDPETMSYHYNKHYIGYVNKLNDALTKSGKKEDDLEHIVKTISQYNTNIRNNAGGAYNHAIFWKMLSPKQQEASGPILKMIQKNFGGIKEFRKKFEASAKERFGSGWVWLVLTKRGALKIMNTPNQDNPLMNIVENGGFPLLGLDLWEHAYYLTYRNQKDKYIENFWRVVNWEYINERLENQQNENIKESMANSSEILEESYSRENFGSYMEVYKKNKELFEGYKTFIDNLLSEVFNENFKIINEIHGVYDIEKKGWSVLNKLNTNILGLKILTEDINKVLEINGKDSIDLLNNSQNKEELKKQISSLMEHIDLFKHRIFDRNSKTFRKLITALSETTKKGDSIENLVVNSLIKRFGENNVSKISGYGNSDDMRGGIDVQVKLNGLVANAQIKPAKEIVTENNVIKIVPSSSIKKYKTDWLIFEKNKKTYVFSNANTIIDEGVCIFKDKDLLFILD